MKILIIGNGGTGKSTLADNLGEELCIPVTHLDLLSWRSDYQRIPEDVFRAGLSEAMKHENMIIEGWAYHSTLRERLMWADVIVYLKYPLEYCLRVVTRRNEEFNNKPYPYDPFTGDRLSMQSLYDEAVTRVSKQYEPELQQWLTLSFMKDKTLFVIESIEQLKDVYPTIANSLKCQL